MNTDIVTQKHAVVGAGMAGLRAALAIRRLAEMDTQLHALSVRVTHLLEPPSVLMRPDIVERAKKFICII